MQGVAIVSATVAVRESLAIMLRSGRTVRQCKSMSECLSLAAAERMDFIFVDDVFVDGTAEEMVSRLHGMGYGIEIIPILLSKDSSHRQRFRQYGVRSCIAKPFNAQEVQDVLEQIEEVRILHAAPAELPVPSPLAGVADGAPEAIESITEGDAMALEVSQRFRRLLARIQSRTELVRTFAESVQEQFDVDNVVVLLPAARCPVYEVAYGTIAEDVKQQFFIPMDNPLVAWLVRLGEPVQVQDCERLGREAAATATRYGERLNTQVLCPVLLHGQLRAIVALSRLHRYNKGLAPRRLLRPFMTFFAEALGNCDEYERLATAGATFRAMFDTLNDGAIAVSEDGKVLHISRCAAQILNVQEDDVTGQPVERVGSMVAHCARIALESGSGNVARTLVFGGRPHQVSAAPMMLGQNATGALVQIRPAEDSERPARDEPKEEAGGGQILADMARTVAHNFKNEFVPLQVLAELLPTRFADEGFRQSFLTTTKASISALCAWIDQLLRLSLLEEQQEWGTFSLAAIVATAVEKHRREGSGPEIDIARSGSEDAMVQGNRDILEHMFGELIENALDAVQGVSNPAVSITCGTGEDCVRVDVRDNGWGMDRKMLAKAVRPFFSGHPTGRLGLGLAYVERVVAVHGGTVDLQSAKGDGTQVHLTFPLAGRSVSAPAPRSAL